MQSYKQFLFSGVGLVSLGFAALVLIGIIYALPTSIRFDLTENNLYTVTDGSKRIIENLEKPIKLQLFFTKDQTKDSPFMRNHAKLAKELLNEMVLMSDGKLELEIVNPVPFSEEEDKAAEYGLTAIPTGTGDKLYLGLAGIGEDDQREVIPFLHPNKENYLEYDISQMIYKLGSSKKPVIGFVSDLQINGGFDFTKGTQTPSWFAMEQLRKLYTVKNLNKDFDKVDDDVDLLMIVHTKDLNDKVLYAIDQYVLNGGKAAFFVDPNSQMEPRNHMMQQPAPENKYPLEALFVKWGVNIPQDKVVGDAVHALNVGAGPGRQPVRHLALIGLGKGNINEDVTTNQLESLNFMTAGYIEHDEKATTTFTPLVKTSTQAGTFDATLFSFMVDPSSLYQSFSATGENYVLAAKVSGKVTTAFPDGKPKEETVEQDSETDKKDDSESDKAEEEPHVHLAESVKDINVMIISDSDLLSDRMWVNVQQFFGQKIANAFADNGNFLTNIVDQFSGSEDLISIRGRENYSRPFYVVEELKRQAENRFREKELELQSQLEETEDKLRELQTPKEGEETVNLSEEQQKTVQEFIAKKLQIRKDLRNVKHQLNKDIKGLGTTIKFINIMIVPLVLIIFVLFYIFFMRRRQTD